MTKVLFSFQFQKIESPSMKKTIFRKLLFVIFVSLISFDLSAQTLPDPGKDPMESKDSLSQKISVSGFLKEKVENNRSFASPDSSNVSFEIPALDFSKTESVTQTFPFDPETRNPI